MTTVFKLFKLQIDEIYNIFKASNIKKLLKSLAKYVLAIFGLFIVVYIALSRILYLGIKLDANFLAIVFCLTQVIAMVFAVENVISNLFLSSNNELLLTFPASPNQIFLSKVMVIYVREVIVNSIYTLPILLGLGYFNSYGAFYMVSVFPLMLVLPLLPLSVAAGLSLPALKLLGFLKNKPIIAIVLMIGVLIAVLFGYVKFLGVFAGFDMGNKQVETVWQINDAIRSFGSRTLIFRLLALGTLNASQYYYVLLYAVCGVAFFVASAFFIRPFFFRAAIKSREDSSSAVKEAKQFKSYHPFWSLVKKEFLTVFRSPGYVFQYFIFALLMPIIVVLYDQLLLSMDIVTKTGRMMIAGSHVLIVALLSMLSNIISASAISREGGNFYIIKTAPISYYVQTGAKLVFNAMFSVTAIIVTCIVTLFMRLAPGNSLDVGVIIATTIAAVLVSIGHMCLSFDLDLKNPTLNWYDSGDITSVNSSTSKSVLYAIFLSFVMAMIIFSTSGSTVGWIALIVLSLAFMLRKAYVLLLRVSYKYDKQEM